MENKENGDSKFLFKNIARKKSGGKTVKNLGGGRILSTQILYPVKRENISVKQTKKKTFFQT